MNAKADTPNKTMSNNAKSRTPDAALTTKTNTEPTTPPHRPYSFPKG
jgi:hypothetical protein